MSAKKLYLLCLVLGAQSLAAAGCAREYLIDPAAYAAALPMATTHGLSNVAIPAVPVDEGPAARPVYVRAGRMELVPGPEEEGAAARLLRGRAPNTRTQREVGRVLLVLGVLHFPPESAPRAVR